MVFEVSSDSSVLTGISMTTVLMKFLYQIIETLTFCGDDRMYVLC
jgi:hypothetical protein